MRSLQKHTVRYSESVFNASNDSSKTLQIISSFIVTDFLGFYDDMCAIMNAGETNLRIRMVMKTP